MKECMEYLPIMMMSLIKIDEISVNASSYYDDYDNEREGEYDIDTARQNLFLNFG